MNPAEVWSPRFAWDLVRVSKDKSGREKSPDDQHADNLDTAGQFDWELRYTYRDIGSASKFARKVRADFERLMRDMQAGKLDDTVGQLWEVSRGSRQMSEWVAMIDLAAERGIRFWIEVRHRLFDPRDHHDRKELINAAADAEFETGLLSDRTTRGTRRGAAAGRPHGRIGFGFERIYDKKTKKLIEQTEVPKEGELLREMFDRLDKGHSFGTIERDWKARGVTNRSGTPFLAANMVKLARNVAYAGRRMHDPTRKHGSHKPTAKAVVVKATWDPIVDPALFDRVQLRLADPSRGRGERQHRWLLTGTAVCGKCGGVSYTRAGALRKDGTRPQYLGCRPHGCAHVDLHEADELVTAAVLAYLAAPENYDAFTPREAVDAEAVKKVTAQLDAVRAELDEFNDRADRGELSAIEARAAAGKERRAAELEAERAELLDPGELGDALMPGADIAERWEAAEFDTRRITLRVVLRPEHLGQLWIMPTGRGRGRSTPTRDRLHFHRGDECSTGPCAAA